MNGTVYFIFLPLYIDDLPIKEEHPLSIFKDQQVIQVFFISILLLSHVFLTTKMLSGRSLPPSTFFKIWSLACVLFSWCRGDTALKSCISQDYTCQGHLWNSGSISCKEHSCLFPSCHHHLKPMLHKPRLNGSIFKLDQLLLIQSKYLAFYLWKTRNGGGFQQEIVY